MNIKDIFQEIQKKKSYLCIGLDTDIEKLPLHLEKNAENMLLFNKKIIDATQHLCVSYKINTAFYEALGAEGWEAMNETLKYIPNQHFKIADAKRGDIGNTSNLYAKAFFETMNFDAITVAPYMGEDSVKPFLNFKDKWVILLGLTSNAGSQDFQTQKLQNGKYLYENVLETSKNWADENALMYVIGATKSSNFLEIRKIIPHHFLLVPGVGSQGGNLAELSEYGMNKECGLLVNISREILYASSDENFAEKASQKASQIQEEMEHLLQKFL
jgi:orotidine-5'-phosphate decarboxylase